MSPRAPDAASSLLLTDLYELNMLHAYLQAGMTETAVFEFFVRKLPPTRGFLMAAGLEQVVEFLETARFSETELAWLRDSGRFTPATLDALAAWRFTGDVDAVPEGTAVFADEPLLRVTAPMPEAQLIETRVINLMHFQTLIATKAARMVLAAPGRTLVDFGLRRAHGAEAGLLAARASYLAGFAGSATTLAEPAFGVPAFGTMAHSFIQAHDDEVAAFAAFARARPASVTLLIDTYDTEEGARRVVALAPKLKAEGIAVRGVRIDSGDLAAHARAVRTILDDGGLTDVQVFASGGLDEAVLKDFTARGVPIDGYGVGTSLTTSQDTPAFDCAYKLQEYAGRARRKRSEGKATWPGRKQAFRAYDNGVMTGDVLTVVGDSQPGDPLIVPATLQHLPAHLRRLETEPPYPVAVAPALRDLATEVDRAPS